MTDWNDRYKRVCNKLVELDQELRIFLRNFDVISLTTIQITVNKIFLPKNCFFTFVEINFCFLITTNKSYESKLSQFDTRMKLLKRIKQNYEKTKFPNELTNILLEVHSPTSLIVSFDDPLENVESFIIKYMSKN